MVTKKHIFRAFLSHVGIFGDFSFPKLEIIGNESIRDKNVRKMVIIISKEIFLEKWSKIRFPFLEIEKSPFWYFLMKTKNEKKLSSQFFSTLKYFVTLKIFMVTENIFPKLFSTFHFWTFLKMSKKKSPKIPKFIF
jgi:hypothetical protein